MAEQEDSEASNNTFLIKGDCVEINSLSKNLCKAEINGAMNNTINGVELRVENNLCFYRNNKESDKTCSSSEEERQKENLKNSSNQSASDGEETELNHTNTTENEVEKLKSFKNAVDLQEGNASTFEVNDAKPLESTEKSRKMTKTDFTKFEAYNQVCAEVQSKKNIEKDFHKASKQQTFISIDEEMMGRQCLAG